MLILYLTILARSFFPKISIQSDNLLSLDFFWYYFVKFGRSKICFLEELFRSILSLQVLVLSSVAGSNIVQLLFQRIFFNKDESSIGAEEKIYLYLFEYFIFPKYICEMHNLADIKKIAKEKIYIETKTTL